MKILVPVDGSPFTKRMLAYLAAHDEWMGGAHQYTVLHAVHAISGHAASVLDKNVLHEYYRDESEKVFKPIRAFLSKKPGLKVTYVGKTGHAADLIAALVPELLQHAPVLFLFQPAITGHVGGAQLRQQHLERLGRRRAQPRHRAQGRAQQHQLLAPRLVLDAFLRPLLDVPIDVRAPQLLQRQLAQQPHQVPGRHGQPRPCEREQPLRLLAERLGVGLRQRAELAHPRGGLGAAVGHGDTSWAMATSKRPMTAV